VIDVAIVGGGVAGCYSAYRLARDRPGEKIHLFEMSDRIGGRIWSVPIENFSAPAEIGAMYFKRHHNHVWALIDFLKLPFEPVNFKRDHHYLRGAYLNDGMYGDANALPFKLAPEEHGMAPIALIKHALEKMVPGCFDFYPLKRTPPRGPEATLRWLRRMRHDGRPLHECGFWNMLSDRVSNEAYVLLTHAFGSITLFRNVNAFDGIWNLMHEFGEGKGHRLKDGYQALPLELEKRAKEHGAEVHLQYKLRHVGREDDGSFKLGFITESGYEVVHAKKVILALPRRALQRVYLRNELFEDVSKYLNFRDNAVVPMRSCKVFLTFDKAWWAKSEEGPGDVGAGEVAAAYTDLPMQQCYYFGKPGPNDPSMLMTAYADDYSASFWAPLVADDAPPYKNPVKDSEDADLLNGSAEMALSARRQLGKMHFDTFVPEPNGILFYDWGRDPHGGAWHGWAPRFKSWEVRPFMRQPNPGLDLFICGEAYSQRNGWVEGAINSAEMVLERMGLGRPEWITNPDFQFEIDDTGEGNMSKAMDELLVALSESLGLQRAYVRDPESIMKAFNLSKEEAAALTAGDIKEVKKVAGGHVAICFLLTED
jgi:lysine 2-monooxygenase